MAIDIYPINARCPSVIERLLHAGALPCAVTAYRGGSTVSRASAADRRGQVTGQHRPVLGKWAAYGESGSEGRYGLVGRRAEGVF